MPLKTLFILLGFFFSFSLFGQSPIEDYNASKSYTTGALVLVGEESYIMSGSGTSLGQAPASNTSVWTNLSVAASALGTPVEDVPTLSTTTILNSLPNANPPGSDGNSVVGAQLLGISTNAMTTNAASVVAGITITGGTKKVVFQVQGAATYADQTGFLSDPRLSIYSGSTLIAQVDDWQSGPVSADSTYYQTSYASDLSASKYKMSGSLEPAIVLNLPIGSYTALVDGKGVEGKVVIGAFDFESSTSSQLLGISTNAVTKNAASVVAGITITGGTKKVVFQVQGAATYSDQTGFLNDPRLSIYSGSTLIAQVDDWQSGPVSVDSTYYQTSFASDLSASKYKMSGSLEPAIVLNLPEGSYTALVDGKGVEGKVVIGAFEFN